MITEVDKFRATSLQIAGFALMAPVGNIVINILEIKKAGLDEIFYRYLSVSIFLLICGIILIVIADFILRKENSERV